MIYEVDMKPFKAEEGFMLSTSQMDATSRFVDTFKEFGESFDSSSNAKDLVSHNESNEFLVSESGVSESYIKVKLLRNLTVQIICKKFNGIRTETGCVQLDRDETLKVFNVLESLRSEKKVRRGDYWFEDQKEKGGLRMRTNPSGTVTLTAIEKKLPVTVRPTIIVKSNEVTKLIKFMKEGIEGDER